jgi:glycosyltransferase involved in cell wall biosynthesis
MNSGPSVIILTLNEEENIKKCIESITGWAKDIHIVDGGSDDSTRSIVREYTNNLYEEPSNTELHEYATIRNWALTNIDNISEWVLFIDADERVPEDLKSEISKEIEKDQFGGYHIHKKHIFMNKWLKNGGQYTKELRLSKADKTKYVDRGDAEYAIIEGEVTDLQNDLIHDDQKPFSSWVETHNQLSEREANRYLSEEDKTALSSLSRNNDDITIEGKSRHWVIDNIWSPLPILLRPFALFIYAYFIKGGFKDGLPGLLYHLHHKFWYRLLIATKIYEKQNFSDS